MIAIKCTIKDEGMLPKYETIRASGMDLKAYECEGSVPYGDSWSLKLFPGQRKLIKTGLCIELPENMEAQVRPRSGLALKQGITVLNSPGTIDEDFRGDIGVILINLGEEPVMITKGDRIAQLVFQKVEKISFGVSDSLSVTLRGEGGFGHTNDIPKEKDKFKELLDSIDEMVAKGISKRNIKI